MSTLTEEKITFGKYKEKELSILLKDRNYCKWLLKQEWFKKNYEYLYNKITEYRPLNFFLLKKETEKHDSVSNFLLNYPFLNLVDLDDLKITLSEDEKKCYIFYKDILKGLKEKIIENDSFNIKAPTGWLKNLESRFYIKPALFKKFLASYDLPNITTVVKEIKNAGGIDYKGDKSFLISKSNSLKQEGFWEPILKKYYKEDIGIQYKYKNCFFDFIRIKTNTIYECKIGLKDFNQKQYDKYVKILSDFSIVYLIGKNCIIDLDQEIIYTTDKDDYVYQIATIKKSDFIEKIKNFEIIKLENIEEYFC